jgi:hypothetical protein
MEVEKVAHYIHRAIFQSDEFHETKHFPVLFSAFADEVIKAVLTVNPPRCLAENFAE